MDEAPTAEALAEELGLSADDRELVGALLRLGVAPERIREAGAHGQVEAAIFQEVLDPERERRTITAGEIEAGGGLAVTDIQAMLRAMGLAPPGPDEPYFTPEEAEAFRELGRLEDVWPLDVRQEASRVYGHALGRIAQTEVHLFRARVEPMLREITSSPLDALTAVRQAMGWLLPLADPLLLSVHRRKLEYELTQAAIWEVEGEAREWTSATVEVSLLFCDLRHFTSFSNRYGDAAGLEVLRAFAEVVEGKLGESGRLIKTLGDGYMLAFPDPGSAIDCTVSIATAMDPDGPAVHAGLHHGRAVFREGDYFGRAVNLAARLLNRADSDELLTTAAVATAAPERRWRSRGEMAFFGFQEPIEVASLDLRRP